MALGKRLIGTGAGVVCNTDSVQAFGADDAFSSNIALYQLDGNADDTTGDYNGTASNITYATGQFGNAAVFNGSSSNINTGGDLVNSLTAITVSGWFYTEPNTNYSYGLQFGKIGLAGDAISISRWNNTALGGIGAYTLYANDGAAPIDGNFTLNEDTWYHIAITWTGTTVKFYVNGNLETTATASASLSIPASGNSGYIGRYITNQNFNWKGNIDQVRIFNRAITFEEVSTLYNESTSTASNTNPLSDGSGVALYSLDYDASDAGGLYDGTPTNVDFGVGGQINYGARFNGSSANISINDNKALVANEMSVSLWAKLNATSVYHYLITNWTSSGTRDTSYLFSIRSDNKLEIIIYANNDSNNYKQYISPVLSNLTDWNHFAFTLTGGITSKLYVNGSEVSTTIANGSSYSSGTINLTGTNDTVIGNTGNLSSSNNKQLDQVRIFKKALSSIEVSTLYAETACVYTSTTDIVNYPTGTTPVAYYKLDNSSEDYSTGGNDGTDTNIEYRFGRFGQAAVFNGSSSKIDINSLATVLDAQNIVSTSFWFKSTNTSLSGLFSYRGSASSEANMIVALNRSATGDIGVDSSTSSAFVTLGTYNGGYNDGNWHHVVSIINYTTGAFSVYIDNTLRITGTNASISRGTADKVQLGANYSTQYLNGSIDQVRIYDTALTSSQVTELYNEKPEVDTSNFKTVLYTGNSSTQYISNVGFEPDLVWLKRSDSAANHRMLDSVRGDDLEIYPNLTNAEGNFTTLNWGFEANGFSFNTSDVSYNASGGDYVAWVWKGGGDAVSNTDGTITSQVSANTDAGFSIVKFNGGNASGTTVGHGLSSAPQLIIVKNTSDIASWPVLTQVGYTIDGTTFTLSGSSNYLALNSTTPYTSYVFDQQLGGAINGGLASDVLIAYCFHSVSGYSKIGSYEGNGTTRNVDLGFNPSWIMIKNADTGSTAWNIVDTRRDTDTTLNLFLQANTSIAEANTTICSLITDGFSVTGTNTFNNSNGDTFIYMAFK